VLCYKGSSEDFITGLDVVATLVRGIPTVFSFNISHHIPVINTLRAWNMTTIGCGFIYDNMPVMGVGSKPVTMNVIRSANTNSMVNRSLSAQGHDT